MTGTAATSADTTRAVGALTTTIAVPVAVFLVCGLAVRIIGELDLSPPGLGLAISAYFGASALASVPAGASAERFGSARVSRAGIVLAAAARALWSRAGYSARAGWTVAHPR